MSITKKYLINGPLNAIRLEKDDKILYMFCDCHLPYYESTQCPYNNDYERIDIDKLIIKFMNFEKKKRYDIFVESSKIYYDLDDNFFINKNKYIFNMSKLLVDGNKKKYKNFKFHHIDIRLHYLYENIFLQYSMNNLSSTRYYLILDLKTIFNLLKKSYYKFKNKNDKINKLLFCYNNVNIENIINIFYKTIIPIFKIILKNIKQLIIKIKSLKTLNDSIIKQTRNILNNIILLYAILNDFYFLKKFLDNNNIKNGILYMGLSHIANIVYILVNYFNFKVSHIAFDNSKFNLNDITIQKSNNYMNYLDKITNSIYNLKYNKYQCVHLFDFPDNFG